METVLIHLLNGFCWGSLVALIALGLSLIYGQLGVINLAHGEFYMLGAVISYGLINYFGSFWLALIVTPIILSLIGLLIEKIFLRKHATSPSSSMLITFALSLCLQHIVLLFFGGAPRRISDPFDFSLHIGTINFPFYRIFVALLAFLIFFGFNLFLNKSRYGLWVRGTGYDLILAKSLGIPVQRIFFLIFGLSCGIASIAGLLAAPIVAVEFKMGTDIMVIAFMSTILGGFGNLKGTFLFSILLGILENEFLIFFEPAYAKVLLLAIVILFTVLKPGGLFSLSKSTYRV